MSSSVISTHSGDKINNSELTGVYHHPQLLKFNWGSMSRSNFEIQDNTSKIVCLMDTIKYYRNQQTASIHSTILIHPFSQSDANSQSDPDSKLRKNTECV